MPEINEDDLIVFRTLADRAEITNPAYIIPKLADAVRSLLAEIERVNAEVVSRGAELVTWQNACGQHQRAAFDAKAELLSHRLDFLRELREKARWHVESETPGDATLNDLAAALERKWTEEAQSTFHNEPCEGCGEDNPPTRACPCGRLYCGHCECDCADWHLVVHEDHEGDYRSCRQPDCVRIKEAPDEDDEART